MTQKYILTGGPGTGKSTLIKKLGNIGEYIIEEAAEFTIRLMQNKGIKEPWKREDFQLRILEFQLKWENDIYQNTKRVFIDRGIPDGLAYATPHTETYERILEETKKTRYDKVFLIESLGFTEKTKVRREDLEESKKLENTIENIYRSFGYDPIRIPAFTIQERLELILEQTDSDNLPINSTLERATMGGK